MEVVSGDGQSGLVDQLLAGQVVIRVTDSAGRPVPGAAVSFEVAAQGGAFTPPQPSTDEAGTARSSWTLGPRSGMAAGTATSPGLPPVSLSATALAGEPGRLQFGEPAYQGVAGAELDPAVEVRVVDAEHNLVTGATARIELRLSRGTLLGDAAVQTVGGVARFAGLRIGEAGTGLVLTASAEIDGIALEGTATAEITAPVPASLSVSPGSGTTLVGEVLSLTATVRDAAGTAIPDALVEWRSSDADVARIDAAGRVTGVKPGTATLTASSGGRSASATISVSLGEGTLTGRTYCTIGGVEDLMDVYIPAASKPRPLPAAVYVHGGGWVEGSRSRGFWFPDLVQRLLDRGYLVVGVDYRLAPAHKYPSQIQDVKCAIRHLRANASRYGLDPERIGVWGASAGAQLAGLLGTTDASAGFDDAGGFGGVSSRVQAVVALSAITDFTSTAELRDDYRREFPTWPDPDSPALIEASPVTHVTSDDSPFFFVVGDADTLVLPAQSRRMDALLRGAGVASSVLTVHNADHGLQPVTGALDPGPDEIVASMVDFFDRHLR